MASRFGALLRQWRLRAGLSQEALAQRADLGVRTIRGLETGERTDPRIDTVRRLADALELTGAERVELFAAAGQSEPVVQPPVDPLAEVVESLASGVRARWQREEEQRQIHDPVPLPVRWEPACESLRDSWLNIAKARPGEKAVPVDLAGRLEDVVPVYRRIRSGRLVVLGRAGSGKTILTTRFVLDLLAARGAADPVPVIFGLGAWHPDRIGLRDWLAEQLARDHPELTAPGPGGVSLAAALVDAGRILPVLDGFDEIAEGLHRPALVALNSTTLPLLLTSRVGEYQDAVAGTDVLTSAAAVELADLDLDDLRSYLPRTTRKDWQPVLDAVQDGGALAAVLTTPLMVALARRIYSDTPDHAPADLLRFTDVAALEEHLLGEFVPAAYQGRDVRRWLGHLADHLDRLGTHDLEWWRLGMSGRAPSAVVGLGVGVAVGVADVILEALVIGGVNARLFTFGAFIAVVTGLLFGLVHALVVRAQPLQPMWVRIRLRGWSMHRGVWLRLRLGLLFGALIGSAYGLVRAMALWLVSDVYELSVGVLVDTGVFAVVFGVATGLIFWLVAALEVPLDTRSADSPEGLLRANRRAVLVQLVLFVPLFAVAVAVSTGLIANALLAVPDRGFDIAWKPSSGLALGLVGGLGGGVAYALALSAWGQWLIFARVWLPLTGRLPWNVSEFLADAYRRGVLRRAGAVYQFRHARLQDHLSSRSR